MYADIQFIINFSLDFLILYLIRALLRSQYPLWRLALAAAFGAASVFIIIFPSLAFLGSFVGKLILSVAIVWIAFGYHSPSVFLRQFSLFYFIFFAVGGGMYAIHSMLQTNHEVWNGMLISYESGYGHPVTWLFLIIGWPIVWWFTRRTMHSVQSRGAITKHYARLEVTFGKHTLSCTGLVDTGNQLHDPITRAPVVIIESQLLRGIVPDSLMKVTGTGTADWDKILELLDDEWGRRFRMIPFRSVAKDNQFMLALKPDKVVVWQDDKPIESRKVLIGIDGGTLSSDGTYCAIIHPGLLNAG